MSKDIESWLKRLEAESAALDMAYERHVRSLPMYHQEISYTINGEDDYIGGDRLLVTLNTATGVNTLAMLGVNASNNNLLLKVARKVYNGGAQWAVNYSLRDVKNITLNFTVDSLVKGTLDVRKAAHG